LRGVGAVAALTSGLHNKVEVVWQGAEIPLGVKAFGAESHVAGDTTRVVIPEEKQEVVLDALRRDGLRLISVTPVRTSLEDYFVAQLAPGKSEVTSVVTSGSAKV